VLQRPIFPRFPRCWPQKWKSGPSAPSGPSAVRAGEVRSFRTPTWMPLKKRIELETCLVAALLFVPYAVQQSGATILSRWAVRKEGLPWTKRSSFARRSEVTRLRSKNWCVRTTKVCFGCVEYAAIA